MMRDRIRRDRFSWVEMGCDLFLVGDGVFAEGLGIQIGMSETEGRRKTEAGARAYVH